MLDWPCHENPKQTWTPISASFSALTSSPLSAPCVALISLSSPLFSILYPSQSQLWCMHEGGFPEDQRGHYPGAIRPLVEHVNECWVLLCFPMQPLLCVDRVGGDSLGMIKCSLKSIRFHHKYLYFYPNGTVCAPCCNIWYSGCFPTVAREEVGSLIGAVVLSCRLRARGVSHHHQDETLWHLSMKVPECLAAQHRWVCLYFTVKEVCRALWSEWDIFLLILAKRWGHVGNNHITKQSE